jgi:hypothetical protein
MIVQASARSAWVLAVTLVAASTIGFAGTDPSYAATDSVFPNPPAMSQSPSDSAPATTDANAAPPEQQMDQQAPAMPSSLAGSAVADNTGTAAPDASANTVSVSNDDNSGWDKASIVGKIFIACGTLLTLGSAARMFMV